MKHTHTKTIDTAGLRQALTTVAIAGALAGWAVMARPEAPVAAITTTSITAPVAGAVPAGGAVDAPSVSTAAPSVPEVSATPSSLRVVTAPPVPVSSTRSSR